MRPLHYIRKHYRAYITRTRTQDTITHRLSSFFRGTRHVSHKETGASSHNVKQSVEHPFSIYTDRNQNNVSVSPTREMQGPCSPIKRLRLPNKKQSQTYLKSALYSPVMKHNDIIGCLEQKIESLKHAGTTFAHIEQGFLSQQENASLQDLCIMHKKNLDILSKKLAQQISKKASYPLLKVSDKINPGLFSELSGYLSKESAYQNILQKYTEVKEEEHIVLSNTICSLFDSYTVKEKMSLYFILALLRAKGGCIPLELLALLELNIKNDYAIRREDKKISVTKRFTRIKKDMDRLLQSRYIPSYKIPTPYVNLLARLQDTCCGRNVSQQKRIFEYIPYTQGFMLPRYVHFHLGGICRYLSLSYMYLIAVHGVQEGREKLLEIMHNIEKLAHYGERDAIKYYRAFHALNSDSHVFSNNQEIAERDLQDEHLAAFNNEGRLTSQEIADILFNPNLCQDSKFFEVREIHPEGLHACSVYRELVENPVTKEKEIMIHYFEPNYGFIRTNNKKLFLHMLMRMNKGAIGCKLCYVAPRYIEGYINRFGNQSIDFLENRVHESALMSADALFSFEHNVEESINARIYNEHQDKIYNILPSILSLYRTWKSLETVAQRYGFELPAVYLPHGGEPITPEMLYGIYSQLNIQRNVNYSEDKLSETLLSLDLSQDSEERSSLYTFLISLLQALHSTYDRLGSRHATEVLSAKEKLSASMDKLYTMMLETIQEDIEL